MKYEEDNGDVVRFRLGHLPSLVAAARYNRRKLTTRTEYMSITGLPTHWLRATRTTGTFSLPRSKILGIGLQGSSSHRIDPRFDVNLELQRIGLEAFSGLPRVTWHENGVLDLSYAALGEEDGAVPDISQLLSMVRVGNLLDDAVIHYIYVVDNFEGPCFLWAYSPKHRLSSTGKYDEWGKAIDDFNRRIYGRHKHVASLDLVAYSDDPSWLLDEHLAKVAIDNAYNVEYFKEALRDVVRGTDAMGLISWRSEGLLTPPAPIVIAPLFNGA